MEVNDLTYKIRGAIFAVYNELGPGLLESVYELALCHELEQLELEVKRQVNLPVLYKTVSLDAGFRLDLIVENQVIIEIKSVDALHNVHKKQLLTYLKLTKMKVGFLVNFNCDKLVDKDTIIRIVN
jgi:GxxExxY protein